jgi:trehalose 2-sulfotransferase
VSPTRSYLVCATPRSGSTLVCQALTQTGVAGRPEEYFEALRHSGRPRRPEEYFSGSADTSILDHLTERGIGEDPPQRSPMWSRTAYDRYLAWAMDAGTTPNGVFGAKLMWGYLGDFTSLLRNIPEYRGLPLAELLPAAFPDLTYVRVVRANKVRQAVSLWKAVQTLAWSESQNGSDDQAAPYKSFLQENRPGLLFHYRAIEHLLNQVLAQEAFWDTFFEHIRVKPILVLYENFASDYATSTDHLLERLGLELPPGALLEPPLRQQSDSVNDDWVKRFSELKLGTEFDLTPAARATPA